jgi:hypothetical protein
VATNLVRAGLARLTKSDYEPWPTVYDGLFPNGTFLTAAKRRRDDVPAAEAAPPERNDAS